MAKYHVNQSTGRPNICRADKRPCPLRTESGEQVPHFDSKEDAKRWYENSNAQHNIPAAQKRSDSATTPADHDYDAEIGDLDAEIIQIRGGSRMFWMKKLRKR